MKMFRCFGYGVIVLSTVFLFASCKNKAADKDAVVMGNAQTSDSVVSAKSTTSVDPQLAFPLPEIPQALQKPEDRAMFLVNHFWDKMDFNNREYLRNPEKLEVSFANFLGLALSLPFDKVSKLLIVPLDSSNGEMLQFFLDNYKKYLYDGNSPMMNEDYYRPILMWAVESPKVKFAEQTRYKELLTLINRNRMGTVATDFIYQTTEGSLHHLNNVNTKYTMLVFYTPGCAACNNLIGQLNSTLEIKDLVDAHKLSVLFIYTESDVLAWKESAKIIPPYVTVGIDEDQTIVSKSLYDLKASPTIYLLDKNLKVLLKDARFDQIINYFKSLS
ncbi:DUF5106 domain-containing protein [Porphyromonas pogonae]|uniref:DUF5106 domain-containing protein n=1 Tax=Porphyromonas pogonae TaxID=867595 RepID=UPI002E76F08C|nr:DUF5106 domain-containing protein [Porphyromonas pogonae]